jgi:hypothetical protein
VRPRLIELKDSVGISTLGRLRIARARSKRVLITTLGVLGGIHACEVISHGYRAAISNNNKIDGRSNVAA